MKMRTFRAIDSSDRQSGTTINLYEGGRFVSVIDKKHGFCNCRFLLLVEIANFSHFDVTVITVGSMVRLPIMPIFASRWNG